MVHSQRHYNDGQIQQEMFVCLVGPPPNTPAAERFVRKVVDKVNFKHVLSEYSRFYKLGDKINHEQIELRNICLSLQKLCSDNQKRVLKTLFTVGLIPTWALP